MSSPDGNSRADFIPEQSGSLGSPGSTLTYGRGGGCFVTRRQGVAVALVLLGALVLAAAFGRYVWAPALSQQATGDNASAASGTVDGGPDVADRPDERLPRGVRAVRYRMHLWPVLDLAPVNRSNFTFQGRLALTVRVESDTDRISLHAGDILTVQDVVVAESSPAANSLADSWDAFPTTPKADQDLQDLQDPPDLKRLSLASVSRTPSWDLLELVLSGGAGGRLMKGGEYTVFLRFNGTLGDSLTGFYRSSYTNPDTKAKSWVAVTHFQPTYARTAFPCMDEPSFRTPFRISIATSERTSAITNAPLNETVAMVNVPGWRWHHFEESVPMPSYLVAYAVTNFSSITPTSQRVAVTSGNITTSSEIEVRLWARPSVLRRGRYAVDMVPKLLAYYSEYFSVGYPLRKLDLLAVPDFEAGAMENWGLVIFRERHLLVDQDADGIEAVELVAGTVAHELAHQWLGNLVTAAWWDELWLNEGFSEYVQTAAIDHIEPTWNMAARFQVYVLQPTLMVDSSIASRAIAAKLRTKHDIIQAFDTITYDKGACLLRMLHHSLGDTTFRRGVVQYMKTWQHNSTTESRLWEPLTEAVLAGGEPGEPGEPPSPVGENGTAHARQAVSLPDNATVADVMSSWTRTTGYPVVNVTVDRDNGKIVFTQERFLGRAWERNCTRPFSGPELWYVPVSLVTRTEAARNASTLDDTRPRVWLTNRTLTLDLRVDGWVLANLHQTGYFRVNYDLETWRLLLDQLRSAPQGLPTSTRAQLLGDAFALAFAGLLPHEVALNLTRYLPRREREPVPWAAALSSLGVVHSQLTGHPDLVLLERYLQRMLAPVWELVAPPDPGTAQPADAHAGLSHAELLHRAEMVAWACADHVAKCEDWARRSVHYWRLQPDPDTNNPIPVLLRPTAYCSAVASGSSDVWDFIWQRYLGTRDGDLGGVDQQSILLKSLTCSSHPARIAYLLEHALDDPNIRPQDAGTVWLAAATKSLASIVEFRYFREHWPRIHNKFGASSLVSSSIVTAASLSVASPTDLQDLAAFRAKHNASLGVASRSLESSAEDLRTAIEWRQKYLPSVKQWLEEALADPHVFTT